MNGDMYKKLTLTIHESVVEKARVYAREKYRSLSDLVENYLISLIDKEPVPLTNDSPMVKAMRGAFELPQDFDYKKELTEILSEKYL